MNLQSVFCDSIRFSGTDTNRLMECLDAFYGTSEQIVIDPKKLYICSIYGNMGKNLQIVKTDMGMATFSNLYTQIIIRNSGDQACLDFFKIPKAAFLNLGIPQKDLDELIRTGMYFEYQGKIIILSDRFLPYMSRMLNVIQFEKGMNPIRDLFIANQLYGKDHFYLTVRRIKNAYKAFYASNTENCCSKFRDICGKVIHRMYNNGAQIFGWEICQDKTEIRFYFPQYEICGFQFGVVFRISDTGEYATSLNHCIYAQSSMFMMGDAALSRKNYGAFDADLFLDEYEKRTNGSIAQYQKGIGSIKIPDKAELYSLYHSLGINTVCGKRLGTVLCEAFKIGLENPDEDNKGLAEILKLPVTAAKYGAKEYVIKGIIRTIENKLEDLVYCKNEH